MRIIRCNVDPSIHKKHRHAALLPRNISKSNSERGLIHLGFSRRMVVDLNDEIRALRNRTGSGFRIGCWNGARRPSTDKASLEFGPSETRIRAVRRRQTPRGVIRIEKYKCVMHDATIAGPELQAAEVHVMI